MYGDSLSPVSFAVANHVSFATRGVQTNVIVYLTPGE